jgi:hypothetical protein
MCTHGDPDIVICLRLFSDDGLRFGGQTMCWELGSDACCFEGGAPGRPSKAPMTIQAHNRAISRAAKVFAAESAEPLMKFLSGHSMRRTAVHLFEAAKYPPSMGMAFTGHKSLEVYMRYATRPSVRALRKMANDIFGGCVPEAWHQ